MQVIDSLSPQDFCAEFQGEDIIIIDVRTQQEREEYGYIKETNLHIDMYKQTFFGEILKLSRDKKYLIYCWHANRTAYLLNFMSQHEFMYVKDLYGGTELWENQGFNLIK